MAGASIRSDLDRNQQTHGPTRTQRGNSARTGLSALTKLLPFIHSKSGGKCTFCGLALDKPVPGTKTQPGDTAKAILTNPTLKHDINAWTLSCPCCAMERDPDYLIQVLLSKQANVFFWQRDEHPTPDEVYATARAMVAVLDDANSNGSGTFPQRDYSRLILDTFRNEGLRAAPIWQGSRELRERVTGFGKELNLPSMPTTQSAFQPSYGTPEEEAWTGNAWGRVITAHPIFWGEFRDRILLLPGPELLRNRHFDLAGYYERTLRSVEEDPERADYVRQRCGTVLKGF